MSPSLNATRPPVWRSIQSHNLHDWPSTPSTFSRNCGISHDQVDIIVHRTRNGATTREEHHGYKTWRWPQPIIGLELLIITLLHQPHPAQLSLQPFSLLTVFQPHKPLAPHSLASSLVFNQKDAFHQHTDPSASRRLGGCSPRPLGARGAAGAPRLHVQRPGP